MGPSCLSANLNIRIVLFLLGAGMISPPSAYAQPGHAHPLVYGTKRPDVPKAGFCDGTANGGFVAIWNWGEPGDGEYTVVVYDNGVEFDRSTFTVTTLGTNFLRGVSGTFTLSDFPQAGDTTRIRWEEGLQNFVIIP